MDKSTKQIHVSTRHVKTKKRYGLWNVETPAVPDLQGSYKRPSQIWRRLPRGPVTERSSNSKIMAFAPTHLSWQMSFSFCQLNGYLQGRGSKKKVPFEESPMFFAVAAFSIWWRHVLPKIPNWSKLVIYCYSSSFSIFYWTLWVSLFIGWTQFLLVIFQGWVTKHPFTCWFPIFTTWTACFLVAFPNFPLSNTRVTSGWTVNHISLYYQ